MDKCCLEIFSRKFYLENRNIYIIFSSNSILDCWLYYIIRNTIDCICLLAHDRCSKRCLQISHEILLKDSNRIIANIFPFPLVQLFSLFHSCLHYYIYSSFDNIDKIKYNNDLIVKLYIILFVNEYCKTIHKSNSCQSI